MPNLNAGRSIVKRPSRWRRWFRAVEFAVQLTVAVLYVIYAVHFCRMTVAFRSALAEMDRDHPGWRLDDVQKARAEVPDAANAASRVVELCQGLPENGIDEEWAAQVERLPPQTQLSPDQLAGLRRTLDAVRPALEAARKLADCPKGRYSITYQANQRDPLLPTYCRSVRKTVRLLRLDAVAEMQAGNAKAAARSIRAALNAGRSIGDEPGCLGAVVRIAGVSVAAGAVKRWLAQSEPDGPDLDTLQKELEAEERYPYWPTAWRGERALEDVSLEAMAEGELVPLDDVPNSVRPGWSDEAVAPLLFQDRARAWGPEFLDYYARLEGTDAMPALARQPLLDQIRQEVYGRRNVLLLTLTILPQMSETCTRLQAFLRCQTTALAAERYRRRHDDWPASLDQLAPELMSAVRDDPYTGRPLIYRRLPDGVVIYAVGKDGVDDGGNVDAANPNLPGADIGVRLWDPAKRRQPPEPPAKAPN